MNLVADENVLPGFHLRLPLADTAFLPICHTHISVVAATSFDIDRSDGILYSPLRPFVVFSKIENVSNRISFVTELVNSFRYHLLMSMDTLWLLRRQVNLFHPLCIEYRLIRYGIMSIFLDSLNHHFFGELYDSICQKNYVLVWILHSFVRTKG